MMHGNAQFSVSSFEQANISSQFMHPHNGPGVVRHRSSNFLDINTPVSFMPKAYQGRKTSKRFLNLNAVKFKLNHLYSTTIRYEVIYKNLLRDLRKYFSIDFNRVTEYSKKRKTSGLGYAHFLNVYINERFD